MAVTTNASKAQKQRQGPVRSKSGTNGWKSTTAQSILFNLNEWIVKQRIKYPRMFKLPKTRDHVAEASGVSPITVQWLVSQAMQGREAVEQQKEEAVKVKHT
jgi:hypothetical protein